MKTSLQDDYNMHGNHTASCICCEMFYVHNEEDISDVTPGAGLECVCMAGCFIAFDPSSNSEDGKGDFVHANLQLAQTCPEFEPRELEDF